MRGWDPDAKRGFMVGITPIEGDGYLMCRFTLAKTSGQSTTARTAEMKDLKSLMPRK